MTPPPEIGASLLGAAGVPRVLWCAPFVVLLLAIAVLPLVPATSHWWHKNSSKLMVALAMGLVAMVHFGVRDFGVHLHFPDLAPLLRGLGLEVTQGASYATTGPGASAVAGALGNALWEYIPFIVVLFALYCITGGVLVTGDVPAHPATNTGILGLGAVLASFTGTTGAAMLLVRVLLQSNVERKRKVHTFVFFIFIVCNTGGLLLPIGDPPLFLGYLKGVPFLWTLSMWSEWVMVNLGLLALYYAIDRREYAKEAARDIALDERVRRPVRIRGGINFLWLVLSVLTVALVVPGKPLLGTGFVPFSFMRELIILGFVGLSFLTTPKGLRREARFEFGPVLEVAALFIGIFIAMQIPLEILAARGGELGFRETWHFYWGTGVLSAVLDNAPTYGVFLQVAIAGTTPDAPGGIVALTTGEIVRHDWLTGVSLGAVLFGAMTYIGNGPNFMVKAICESQGIKMPSFFGYVLWSGAALLPLLALATLLLP